MASEFVSVLKAAIFFTELVIHKYIHNALISDW